MTRADADHARRRLHQVREELTGRFAADEPAGFCWMCSICGLRGTQGHDGPAHHRAYGHRVHPLPLAGSGWNRPPAWYWPGLAASRAVPCPGRQNRAAR